jgi:uncharacterized protein (UPF0335 family)
MTIKINIIEAASELAENELNSFFLGKIYEESEEETNYTEEAQEVFNELYDKYFDLLYNMQEPITLVKVN